MSNVLKHLLLCCDDSTTLFHRYTLQLWSLKNKKENLGGKGIFPLMFDRWTAGRSDGCGFLPLYKLFKDLYRREAIFANIYLYFFVKKTFCIISNDFVCHQHLILCSRIG